MINKVKLLDVTVRNAKEILGDAWLSDRAVKAWYSQAAEALQLVLVSEVLPRGDLLPRAHALAQQLARQSDLVLRYTRVSMTQLIKRQMHDILGYGLALEGLGSADSLLSQS